MHALANLSEEGGYAIRHGMRFVSTFPNCEGDNELGNFSTRAFPTLFPYGFGGLEEPRKPIVTFMEHIWWCLRYYDCCFRVHDTFPFVMFGIQQQWEALTSACLQMSRKDFEYDMKALLVLQPKDFQKASVEEKANVRITNSSVRTLYKHLQATNA